MSYQFADIKDVILVAHPMIFMLLDILLLQYIYGPNMTTVWCIILWVSFTATRCYLLNSIEDKLVSRIWDR